MGRRRKTNTASLESLMATFYCGNSEVSSPSRAYSMLPRLVFIKTITIAMQLIFIVLYAVLSNSNVKFCQN